MITPARKFPPAVQSIIDKNKNTPKSDIWEGGVIGWHRVTHIMLADGWHECKQFCLTDIETTKVTEENANPDHVSKVTGLWAQWSEVGGPMDKHEMSAPFKSILAVAESAFNL